MTQLYTCFRLLAVFCILVSANVTPGSAEQNFNNIPMFTMRQQQTPQHLNWKNPVSMSSMNQAWQNNGVAAARKVRDHQQAPLQAAFAEPSAGLAKLQMPQVADMIASNVLRFALNVGSQLSENAYFSKSEVFSPLSIFSALALLLAGARGKSYQQLKPIFGFNLNTTLSNDPNYAQMLHQELGLLLQDIEKENVGAMHQRQNAKWRDTPQRGNIRSQPANRNPIVHIIKVVNGIFAQYGYSLNPTYSDVLRTIYNSDLMQLDFQNNGEAARFHINSWVDKNTFGKIKNVLNNAIPRDTNMILASVLYFKGFWEHTFFESTTMPDNFYPEGEGRGAIKVAMMATAGVFPYYETPDFRIIGLPYRGNLSTMYIIQPYQSSRAKLKDFQNKITPEVIEDMISKMEYRSAVMAFPKLHLVRQLNLKEILQKFGVMDIFSSATSDLSLINDFKPQYQYSASATAPQTTKLNPLSFQPIQEQTAPIYASRPVFMDRYNEKPLFFSSRFGEIGNLSKMNENNQTAKVMSTNKINDITTLPTKNTDKDIITTTPMPMAKNFTSEKPRRKRQIPNDLRLLNLLEEQRLTAASRQSDLYVADILHKVDFEVNEHGTEAAAATLTTLRKSGTDIVFRCDTPFMLLLRHDPSKLVLFYATVNEPEI